MKTKKDDNQVGYVMGFEYARLGKEFPKTLHKETIQYILGFKDGWHNFFKANELKTK